MEDDNDDLELDDANEWDRSMSYSGDPLEGGENGSNVTDDVEIYPLVTPDEKHLVTDYLYLALEQMQPYVAVATMPLMLCWLLFHIVRHPILNCPPTAAATGATWWMLIASVATRDVGRAFQDWHASIALVVSCRFVPRCHLVIHCISSFFIFHQTNL
jgi:hypothetical protein